MDSTIVTYHLGNLSEHAKVKEIVPYFDKWAVICDITAMHPVDHKWPDQPADRGWLVFEQNVVPVIQCIVAAAQNGSSTLFFDCDIPVGRGKDGWRYYVAHIVERLSGIYIGADIRIDVEAEFRYEVSAGHTGCHLAALALNSVLSKFWKKGADIDGLGNPDFDQTAIQVSKIAENQSFDKYRVGKTLKKRGFRNSEFWEFFPELQFCINKQLASWATLVSEVWVTPKLAYLSTERRWNCEIFGELLQMGTSINAAA